MAKPNSSNLTFADEFNTLSVWNGSTGTWQYSYWWSPGGYTDPPSMTNWWVGWNQVSSGVPNPFSVNNGILTNNFMPTPASALPSVGNTPFLSGLLTTYPSFAQTYGYFEMRAQLAAAPGLVSAFWLLPVDGSWPPELDIEEVLGNDPTMLVMTAHADVNGTYTAYPHWITVADLSTSFHTYAVDWERSSIAWYLDGQQVAKQATPPGMNKPMYILTDISSGTSAPDSWSGAPVPGETAQMKIDYIHAYKTKPSGSGTAQQTLASAQTTPYTVDPTDSTVVILDSNIAFTVASGDHMFFIEGNHDTAMLTSGVEKVDASGAANRIVTGPGNDTIHITGSGDAIDAGAGNNSIVDEGSANTITMPKAGQGFDDIAGAVLQIGDILDFRAALANTQWNGQQSDLSNFLHVNASGNDAILSVSTSAGSTAIAVATLHDAGPLSLENLLTHVIV
jgi:beta-glucanase (GH16 family)